jgi:hypothetical protein
VFPIINYVQNLNLFVVVELDFASPEWLLDSSTTVRCELFAGDLVDIQVPHIAAGFRLLPKSSVASLIDRHRTILGSIAGGLYRPNLLSPFSPTGMDEGGGGKAGRRGGKYFSSDV